MWIFAPRNVKKMKAAGDDQGLIVALKDESKRVRMASAKALGQVGGRRAVEPLIVTAVTDFWEVRNVATGALGKIGEPGLELLITLLKGDDVVVVEVATEALDEIGDVRAVESLIAALNNDDARGTAAEALGKIGDARAVKPI